MSKFFLRIASPEREVYSGQIDYLCVDAPDGKIGFMRGALPGIYAVSAGAMDITDDDNKLTIVCGDGILSVEGDTVTALVSSAKALTDEADEGFESRAAREQDYAKARIMSGLYRMKNGDNKKDV